jgi:hypothetical protein
MDMPKHFGNIAMVVATMGSLALSNNVLAERTPDEGTVIYTEVKRDTVSLPHNTGQTLSIAQRTGRLKEAPNPFMPLDGATVSSVVFADVTKGNGSAQNWAAFTKDGDTSYVKSVAQISTIVGPDGKPVTSITGTYEKIGGTGKFKNLRGAGTFISKPTSPTTSEVTYKGWVEDAPQ